MSEAFSFRSRGILAWLLAMSVLTVAIELIFTPEFWLCMIGAMLITAASIAQSARTGQWFAWQKKGPLNWFEGLAASAGAILVVVPFLIAIVRSNFG